MSAHPFPLAELEAEVRRELGHRVPFYERRVAEGRMRRHFADRQIAMMRAIGADLRAEMTGQPAEPVPGGWRFTDEELAECAERELGYRRRVYDRAVEARTMSPNKAERLIALMAAIAERFRARVPAVPQQGSLL